MFDRGRNGAYATSQFEKRVAKKSHTYLRVKNVCVNPRPGKYFLIDWKKIDTTMEVPRNDYTFDIEWLFFNIFPL